MLSEQFERMLNCMLLSHSLDLSQSFILDFYGLSVVLNPDVPLEELVSVSATKESPQTISLNPFCV